MEDLAPHNQRRRAWWFVAGYCLLIFVGSSIPGREMPVGVGSDKVLHAVEYMILGVLLMYALQLSTHWRWPLALSVVVLLGSLYGVTDELHQMFTPRRDPSSLDVVADTIGSAIGAAGVAAVALIRRRG